MLCRCCDAFLLIRCCENDAHRCTENRTREYVIACSKETGESVIACSKETGEYVIACSKETGEYVIAIASMPTSTAHKSVTFRPTPRMVTQASTPKLHVKMLEVSIEIGGRT
jgi:hypothetical protein